MQKITPLKPLLVLLYGYPGSGKTYFARQFCENVTAAHVSEDRIRYELFDEPRYDKQEDSIVEHLMLYMTEEFMSAGLSVVYDANAARLTQRRGLRDLARKVHGESLLIWQQTDPDSAFARTAGRDRRRADDKYSMPYTRHAFDQYLQHMQNPQHEDYVVISGKHTYATQRNAVLKKLYEQGLISIDTTRTAVVKPGLINLVPNLTGGRVDIARRNIRIR